MQEARVFVYGGTWPACYTLTFIEAMMTGIPVVSLSRKLAGSHISEKYDYYEIDEIIKNGVNGYVCDSIEEMRGKVQLLLENYEHAKEISVKARKTAIEYFGREKIANQWQEYLLKGDKKHASPDQT